MRALADDPAAAAAFRRRELLELRGGESTMCIILSEVWSVSNDVRQRDSSTDVSISWEDTVVADEMKSGSEREDSAEYRTLGSVTEGGRVAGALWCRWTWSSKGKTQESLSPTAASSGMGGRMVDVLRDATEAEYKPGVAGTKRWPVGVTGGVGSSSTEDKDEGGGIREDADATAGSVVGVGRAGGAGKRDKDISETVLEEASHSDPLESLECPPACRPVDEALRLSLLRR